MSCDAIDRRAYAESCPVPKIWTDSESARYDEPISAATVGNATTPGYIGCILSWLITAKYQDTEKIP